MTKLLESVIQNLSSKQRVSYGDNDVIIGLSRRQKHTSYITKGYVIIYDLNADGTMKTIAILKKGDLFPLSWCLDTPPDTVYCYKAMGPVHTVKVETAELKETLRNDTCAARDSHMEFVTMAWDFMERIKCLQMPYTKEKILRLLPYLVAKIGGTIKGSKHELNYPITQVEIAQLIGATRESVSAHLSQLEDLNIISRKDNRVTVDMEKIPEEYLHDYNFYKIVAGRNTETQL
jgi:CRP/FNR family transcriptional regulator